MTAAERLRLPKKPHRGILGGFVRVLCIGKAPSGKDSALCENFVPENLVEYVILPDNRRFWRFSNGQAAELN